MYCTIYLQKDTRKYKLRMWKVSAISTNNNSNWKYFEIQTAFLNRYMSFTIFFSPFWNSRSRINRILWKIKALAKWHRFCVRVPNDIVFMWIYGYTWITCENVQWNEEDEEINMNYTRVWNHKHQIWLECLNNEYAIIIWIRANLQCVPTLRRLT